MNTPNPVFVGAGQTDIETNLWKHLNVIVKTMVESNYIIAVDKRLPVREEEDFL